MRDANRLGTYEAVRAAREQLAATSRYEGTFCADDLPAVRRLAAEHGGSAGLDSTRLSDFVLAVNEAVTNAFCCGSEQARLRLGTAGNGVFCDVLGGRWVLSEQSSAVRPDDTENLRLWVIQRVCSDVAVSAGPDGTTMRLSMSLS
jgi:serine/threonine-protein kinase RsbW